MRFRIIYQNFRLGRLVLDSCSLLVDFGRCNSGRLFATRAVSAYLSVPSQGQTACCHRASSEMDSYKLKASDRRTQLVGAKEELAEIGTEWGSIEGVL